PEELRRSALGGEVVEVTTKHVFDASTLAGSPGVIGVRQSGPRDFRLIVEDAGTASADTVETVMGVGGEVEAVREVRPTFEEVFAALVQRDRAERESRRPASPGAGRPPAGAAC